VKVNETVALNSPKCSPALAGPKVRYFTGDWTKHDAAIGGAGCASARRRPLYLVYKPARRTRLFCANSHREIVLDAL